MKIINIFKNRTILIIANIVSAIFLVLIGIISSRFISDLLEPLLNNFYEFCNKCLEYETGFYFMGLSPKFYLKIILCEVAPI
ncbi:MAG: hypothetical protein ACO2XZ_05440 [Rickettsiales bacterium]